MTENEFKISVPKIQCDDSLFFMGSCFSENISKKLLEDKLNVISNPFGVIFHPQAMLKLFIKSLSIQEYRESDFFYWDNYWFNYEHHSELAKVDLAEYVKEANLQLANVHQKLKQSKYLFITFGSAWGYELNGEIVANCHQQNSQNFSKKLMDLPTVKAQYLSFFYELKKLNPNIKICLTVSPVRHYKDGMVNNQISKSNLILLCHQLAAEQEQVFYFPSYEYVIDVLRDYAFFKSDGLHPNEIATDHTYDFFKKTFFDEELIKRTEKWDKIKLLMKHNSLRPLSNSNKELKRKLLSEINNFAVQFKVSCDEETNFVKNKS